MRINDEQLYQIRKHYGSCSSWAIWAEANNSPLEGLSDLSVFDFEINPQNRILIHADFVIVGLNISGSIDESPNVLPFANFHSKSRWAKDYKMRDAFRGTPLWGSYMTDILKYFPEVNSSNVKKFIRENPGCLDAHFEKFDHELSLIAANRTNLVALGGLTSSILRTRYGYTNKIITIKHYAAYISADNYRSHVHKQLSEDVI